MSYSIDVNLLLYSSDTSSSFHSRARAFLEACAGNDEPLYLCYLTLMGLEVPENMALGFRKF